MSRTSQYALYALHRFHGRPEGQYLTATAIAEAEKIPSNYVSKVLRELVRAGILTSVRGPNGGFKLKRPLSDVNLLEVRQLFDGPWADRACVLGLGACEDDAPCAAHHNWLPVADTIEDFLQRTSVADIVADPRLGNGDQPTPLFRLPGSS